MHAPLAILVLGAILTAKGDESDKMIAERCMHELGLTTESYGAEMINGTGYSEELIKCIDACLLKAYGIMKDDGTFDLDTVMKLISDYPDDENAKREIAESCIEKKGDNACDTAHMMMTCMNKEMNNFQENN